VKEALVGSPALKEQGILLRDSISIPYLHGILPHSDSDTGLLRRPVFYKNDKIPLKTNFKLKKDFIKDEYFGLNGFFAQLIIVLSNLLVLFLIPLPMVGLGYFVMTERASVQADPFGVVYSF